MPMHPTDILNERNFYLIHSLGLGCSVPTPYLRQCRESLTLPTVLCGLRRHHHTHSERAHTSLVSQRMGEGRWNVGGERERKMEDDRRSLFLHFWFAYLRIYYLSWLLWYSFDGENEERMNGKKILSHDWILLVLLKDYARAHFK